MKGTIILAIIVILLGMLIFSIPCNGQKPRKQKPLTVKVDYVLRNDDGTGEVWVKQPSRYSNTARWYWVGLFLKPIPDSIKVGLVLTLQPNDKKDSCGVVFKPVKLRSKK